MLLASVVWYEVNEKRNRFEITIVNEYMPEIPWITRKKYLVLNSLYEVI